LEWGFFSFVEVMILPRFELDQDENSILVKIHTPHVKSTEMEYSISEDGYVFRFYVSPYFLKLTFSQKIDVREDLHVFLFDTNSNEEGMFNVKLRKCIAGESFTDLQMITKLLSPSHPFNNNGLELLKTSTRKCSPNEASDSKRQQNFPLIQPLDDINDVIMDSFEEEQVLQQQAVTKQCLRDNMMIGSSPFSIKVGSEIDDNNLLLQSKTSNYGFDSKYSRVFDGFLYRSNIREIVELDNIPDDISNENRLKQRITLEEVKFDQIYYIQDFIDEDGAIKGFIEKTNRILKIPNQSLDFPLKQIQWSDKEQQMLSNLPRKEFIIDHLPLVLTTLVDILCSYAYMTRTTSDDIENHVEASWTISKLSHSLSYLDEISDLKTTVIVFIRRVLCFAYARNFELAMKCVLDVITLLKLGRFHVLRCLLEIKALFDHDTEKYILNLLLSMIIAVLSSAWTKIL